MINKKNDDVASTDIVNLLKQGVRITSDGEMRTPKGELLEGIQDYSLSFDSKTKQWKVLLRVSDLCIVDVSKYVEVTGIKIEMNKDKWKVIQ